jgi:hypothetical protein
MNQHNDARELWLRHPYLGGYRHKVTKVEYYNASTQTTTAQELKAQVNPSTLCCHSLILWAMLSIDRMQTRDSTEIRRQSLPATGSTNAIGNHLPKWFMFFYTSLTASHITRFNLKTKNGCFVSSQTDYVIIPKRYISAAEHHAMIVENVNKMLPLHFLKVNN